MKDDGSIISDLLVIGCGLAGVRAAQAAARMGVSVVVVGKGTCASSEIMGFNAAISTDDSIESYYNDILRSGKGINNGKVAQVLAEGASYEVSYLENMGLTFDKNADGSHHTLHTLGCTYPRLVHYKTFTGLESCRVLIEDAKKYGVRFEKQVMITDLIRYEGRIAGAIGLDLVTGTFLPFRCKAVILATGGCGGIYGISTYPRGISGDGYAIAYRAGADLVDMEFQQYEPCCFVYPEAIRGSLVPTTLLRAGAKLVNARGEEFMGKYGLTRDNAQKGELSRAIATEIAEGAGTEHGGVYYDLTGLPRNMVVVDHCLFYNPALEAGVDLTKQPAEMAPAAHTFLGGIRINEYGATSINGLFAAGEVTGGVHGANRLGGCAGAEALVFGGRAGKSAAEYIFGKQLVCEQVFLDCMKRVNLKSTQRQEEEDKCPNIFKIQELLGEIMMKNVGIIRNNTNLQEAMTQLDRLQEMLSSTCINDGKKLVALYQCKNSILTARMQVTASLLRKESRGVFFRSDFCKQRDDIWLKNIIIRQNKGVMEALIETCK